MGFFKEVQDGVSTSNTTKEFLTVQKKIVHTLLFIMSLSLAGLFFGCDSQGTAEKTGETIDQAIENTKDALEEASDKITGKGPLEKAGEKIDEVIGAKK